AEAIGLEGEAAVAQATEAARALEAHGEPYTAARLLADLLPFLDEGVRRPLAEDVAERLARMGARTSAADARRLYRSSSRRSRRALRTANPSQSLLK
ncbi:MAG: hypothetical protein ACRDPC_27305, partial [Solirubrobacteraceae bacterium]